MAHYVVNDDGVVTRKIKKKDKEKNLGAFGSADIVTRPKPSTLKTVGSTIRNTGMLATEGAVKDLEGKLDTANKLSGNINDRLLHVANTVIFGKDKADEQLKKDKKNQREFIERDLTKEAAQKTGFDKEQQEAEEDSVVKRNNFGGQMAYGIGQMLPNVAIGRLTGLNLKGKSIKGLKGTELAKTLASNAGKAAINQLPSTLSLGSSSYGNAYESALQQGYSEKEANDYALANAAIETGTEMITGGIPGTNGVGSLDDIAEKGINKALRGYGRAVAKTAGRAVGEGSEEKIGTYLDALARQNILGEKQNWKDVEKESNRAFLVGGAIGGVLNAPQTANDIRVARNENLANKLTAVKGFNEVERSALTDITRRIKAGENIDANDMATINYLNARSNQLQKLSSNAKSNNIQNANNQAKVNTANNRVQQIQQAVQNGEITTEQGIQEIQNITNSLTAQNQAQNQPKQVETTQPNTNTQETQNVAQQPNKAVNEYQEPTARQMTPEEVEEMSRIQTESLNRMAETEGYNKETPGEQLVQNNNVSDRKVKAVQYENPEIKPYYKEMAEFIADEAHEGANMAYEGGLIQDDSGYGAPDYRRYGGWNGLLGEVDEFAKENHMTARQVEKAAQDIIEDDGKENNANAKKVEQLIDKRLRNGFTYMGDNFEPNQEYINKMEEIAYEKQRQGELESLENDSKTVETNETTQNNKQENTENSAFNLKQKQNEIIQNTNPMNNEYNTGIRSENDIRTWDEVLDLDDDSEGQFAWGDYTREDALRDQEKGTVTVYSSYPIENGNFVSTSKIQAEEYAGGPGSKVYSKEVPLNEVAWINGDEGQYAKVENNQQNIENIAETREDSVAKKLSPEKNKSTSSMENIRQDVEEKTNKTMSKHIETSSKATGTVEDIKNMDYDTIVYEATTNKKSKEQALRELKGKDIDTNVNDVHSKFRGTERLTDVDSAKITELMKQTKSLADEAAKSGKDSEYNKRMEQFRTLKGDYAVALSESGQFVQYAKVIKELDPETQMDVLEKVIEREQRRGNKKYEDVTINKDLVEKYKKAKTDEERDTIMEEIKDDTARQIKITFVDKANEFRFLSMLGNLKTHARNIFGNFGMYSLQTFKDGVATIGENIYNKTSKNGLETRSKTLKPATKEVRKFVSDKVDSFLKDQKSKYNESRGMKGDLEERTKKFSDNNIIGKALNKASNINSKALNWEDKFFSSLMTKQAMKGFLTANGIETNADIEAHPELVAQALDYALFKGKEATFHQDSTTATAIKNTRDKLYTGSGFSKLGGLAIDASLPFVSTPANIAKNALEYTPIIGFGDINKQLQQAPDNMKANVFIDSISKQFSGAALMAVGAYLASIGKVKGSGDDDKEDKTEASLGNASYAIKLGDSTYDLSWLSPTAIPFFEGVEVFNAFKKAKSKSGIKATDTADLIDTMFGTLNPMTDMSVLQSIERIITSIAYGGNAVKSATSTTFSSYLQQYIPTLLSQIAQTGDTKQRNTNTGGNVLEKTFDQIKYKIPGARNTLPERLDVWGKANKTANNFPQKAFEAFLSPANRKDYKVDKTTKELERLAKETDDTAMLPTIKNKSLRVNGKDYKLKGEDYVGLQRTYGKTAKKNLDKLINSAAYKNANDVEKRSMVQKLYDYASYKSKEKYAKNKGIDFDSANQTSFAMVDAFDIPYEKYVENKVSGNESASKMLKKLNKLGLDEAQKGAVMNYFNRSYYVDENELYDTLENSDLSDKQKELISAKYKKAITDKERARYKRADDIGIDYDLYTNFRGFVNSARGESRTGGLTKNQKIINYIQKLPLTANQKQKLWTDYKNNKGFMTYYK